jgi:uncharacterized protein
VAAARQAGDGGGLPAGSYPACAQIDACGDGGFRFAGMSHRGSLLALPTAMQAWAPADVTAIEPTEFVALFSQQPGLDFVLLGTGATHVFPTPALAEACAAAGITLEVMTTRAACRTWNVVLAEGRTLAAALIAVP